MIGVAEEIGKIAVQDDFVVGGHLLRIASSFQCLDETVGLVTMLFCIMSGCFFLSRQSCAMTGQLNLPVEKTGLVRRNGRETTFLSKSEPEEFSSMRNVT